MQYELSETDRHRIYLALLGEKREVERRIAMGPESGWEGHLEAWEANTHVLENVERLLSVFAPRKRT